MAEYIEKAEVIKKLCLETAEWYLSPTIKTIKEFPASDVQPVKRGHWESSQYLWETGQTRCSNCMAEFYADDLMCISGDDKNIPDFCPCCGADMRNE